jgi:hypothetical protein
MTLHMCLLVDVLRILSNTEHCDTYCITDCEIAIYLPTGNNWSKEKRPSWNTTSQRATTDILTQSHLDILRNLE